jgi:hypothetical protein
VRNNDEANKSYQHRLKIGLGFKSVTVCVHSRSQTTSVSRAAVTVGKSPSTRFIYELVVDAVPINLHHISIGVR